MANLLRPSYEILNILPDSDRREIRKRYKALVREFPPEKHPEKFAEISAAYRKVIGEDKEDYKGDFPIYRTPFLKIKEKIAASQNNKDDEGKLIPLKKVPASIFNVNFELEKLIK